jgi:hypothetical protein
MFSSFSCPFAPAIQNAPSSPLPAAPAVLSEIYRT